MPGSAKLKIPLEAKVRDSVYGLADGCSFHFILFFINCSRVCPSFPGMTLLRLPEKAYVRGKETIVDDQT